MTSWSYAQLFRSRAIDRRLAAVVNSRPVVGTMMSNQAALTWRDVFQTVHACEEIDLRQAFLLVRTACGRNVPPNARWPHGGHDAVTCPDCRRAAKLQLQGRS
jgi:hypothetical protein